MEFKDMNATSIKTVHMNGPYEYNKLNIAFLVDDDKDGNYRTGHLDKDGSFIPMYTGRGNIADRLSKHIDEGFKDTHFKFVYEADAVKSYQIECADFHRFGNQLRNKIHPAKPEDHEDEVCPYCGE